MFKSQTLQFYKRKYALFWSVGFYTKYFLGFVYCLDNKFNVGVVQSTCLHSSVSQNMKSSRNSFIFIYGSFAFILKCT